MFKYVYLGRAVVESPGLIGFCRESRDNMNVISSLLVVRVVVSMLLSALILNDPSTSLD